MPKRLTIETINDELERLGFAERLEKATGYFVFSGGQADSWLDRTVPVRTLGSLTVKEWIAEFRRLKAVNEQIMGTARKSRKSKA